MKSWLHHNNNSEHNVQYKINLEIMICWSSRKKHVSTVKQNKKLTLDDGQSTPLSFLPARVQKPLLHFSNQLRKVIWIRLHDLIKLGKLSRPKEDFCHSKLELIFAETKSFEQSLKQLTTPQIQS